MQGPGRLTPRGVKMNWGLGAQGLRSLERDLDIQGGIAMCRV